MEIADKFYAMDDESQKLKQQAEQQLQDVVNQYSFSSLLDVGCGDGHFLHYFKDKNVRGIDSNKDMLSLAQGLEGKLYQADITKELCMQEKYDIISSNYVFSELNKQELTTAFKNIYDLLADDGVCCFTMTDPRSRHKKEFPGYKLVFDEDYDYKKEDTPFTVLLQAASGDYVDVGIRDVHNPLEVYDTLLKKAGFSQIKRQDIKHKEESFAVLYELRK